MPEPVWVGTISACVSNHGVCVTYFTAAGCTLSTHMFFCSSSPLLVYSNCLGLDQCRADLALLFNHVTDFLVLFCVLFPCNTAVL
jgi:hypothetical protein